MGNADRGVEYEPLFEPEYVRFPKPWVYDGQGEHGHVRVVNEETGRVILLGYGVHVTSDIEYCIGECAYLYGEDGKELRLRDVAGIPQKPLLKALRAATMFQSKKRRIEKRYPQSEIVEFEKDPYRPLPTVHRPYPKCFIGLVAMQYNSFAVSRQDEDPELLMREVNKYNLSQAALHRWVREAASWRMLVEWPDFNPEYITARDL